MADYRIEIRRFDPERDEAPHWESYAVSAEPGDRLLDVLHQIKWYRDSTLSFRRSCAHGVCGSDAMVINGANALACTVMMSDLGPRVRIEPLRGLPVKRDLVVAMEPFYEQYRSVKPWLRAGPPPSSGRERVQSPPDRARFDDTTKCILCAACTTSCPVFWGGGSYIGPAAIVGAHRFLFDSRDEAGAERMEILDSRSGAWGCRTAFNCTEACPRGIKVTEAIAQVKRRRFSP